MSATGSGSLAKGPLWLLVLALMLGVASKGLAYNVFVAALPQMAKAFGAGGMFLAQMTTSMVSLGQMVGALASGWVLERTGARKTLAGAAIAFGLAGGSGLFAHIPQLLLPACFVTGFATACMVTSCMWGIAEQFEGGRRARAVGAASSLTLGVSMIANVAGGALAEHGGWTLSFIEYPIFASIVLLCCTLGVRNSRPAVSLDGGPGSFQFQKLLPLYILTTFLYIVLLMGNSQFSFLLAKEGVANSATRSLILSTTPLLAAMASLAYGPLQQRLGFIGVFLLGLACGAVGLAIAALGVGLGSMLLAAALIGIYAGLVIPYLYHIVSERTDASSRSRAIGMLVAFAYFGTFSNPFILAALPKTIELQDFFLLMAIAVGLVAIGAAAILVIGRFERRKHARAAQI